VECGFLLDVVVGKSAAVFELLTGEDEALLIGWDTILVLDISLDVLELVRRLDIEGDGLASQSLDEDLHATTESEDKVKG
jgi:inner membrane protein involved in colicin E2 resistance